MDVGVTRDETRDNGEVDENQHGPDGVEDHEIDLGGREFITCHCDTREQRELAPSFEQSGGTLLGERLTMAGETEYNKSEEKLQRAQDEEDKLNHGDGVDESSEGALWDPFASFSVFLPRMPPSVGEVRLATMLVTRRTRGEE